MSARNQRDSARARPACEQAACAFLPRQAGHRIREGDAIRLVRVSLVAVAVVLSAAACGGSGQAASGPPGPSTSPRPGSAARLTIITPANGEVIHARTVHVKVRLTGANAKNPAAIQALPGYLHLYLDSAWMAAGFF